MGAKIEGGTSKIRIEGIDVFSDTSHQITDRINILLL